MNGFKIPPPFLATRRLVGLSYGDLLLTMLDALCRIEALPWLKAKQHRRDESYEYLRIRRLERGKAVEICW